MLTSILNRLIALQMYTDEHDVMRPWMLRLTDPARDLLDTLRRELREQESGCDGVMLPYIGKLPGFTLRLSLILTMLDWASDGGSAEPMQVTSDTFARAAAFTTAYAVPMAGRAYANGCSEKGEAAARRLVQAIRDRGWSSLISRDAMRLRLHGLHSAAQLHPVFQMLSDGDVICEIPPVVGQAGGRPERRYVVNPAVFAQASRR